MVQTVPTLCPQRNRHPHLSLPLQPPPALELQIILTRQSAQVHSTFLQPANVFVVQPPADPLPAFRDFVTNEKQRLTQKRQALVKSEMDKRMADLIKFSQSFKVRDLLIWSHLGGSQPQVLAQQTHP
jgi:hypothetical protein